MTVVEAKGHKFVTAVEQRLLNYLDGVLGVKFDVDVVKGTIKLKVFADGDVVETMGGGHREWQALLLGMIEDEKKNAGIEDPKTGIVAQAHEYHIVPEIHLFRRDNALRRGKEWLEGLDGVIGARILLSKKEVNGEQKDAYVMLLAVEDGTDLKRLKADVTRVAMNLRPQLPVDVKFSFYKHQPKSDG